MAEGKKITICSVGDFMLCDSPLYVSTGVGSNYMSIRNELFAQCAQGFKGADITIGNFEGVVHQPAQNNLKELQMACSPIVIKDLLDAGVTILNLANNHCLQHGAEEFLQTKAECEKNGIRAIGVKNEEPYCINHDGIELVFLSLCIHHEWYMPNDIKYENDIDNILRKIKKIKDKKPNIVVVLSVHWGDEFATFPSNAQVALGHTFVDCGADIILGHHSHVFQGIEKYRGSLIVYGQGNFISDMVPSLCRETGIVKITITKNDERIESNYELLPYYVNDSFIPEACEGNWFAERQKALEKVLEGKVSDEVYWQMREKNHKSCHDTFTKYFFHHIRDYSFNIYIRMIRDFIKRKFDKVIGKSNHGRKGGMDQEIYESVRRAYFYLSDKS